MFPALIKTAKIVTFLTAAALPSFAMAQNAIDYRIVVRTMTNDSWTDGFGTDNWIYMTMYGETGSKKVELKGDHESGDLDAFTYSTKDIGVIHKITIDVSGDLADKWGPLDIKVLRGTNSDSPQTADGWSKFYIGRKIGYDPVSYSDPNPTPKAVTITPNGQIVNSSVTQTFVNIADNLNSSTPRPLMKFWEEWGTVNSTSVSTQEVDSFSTGLQVSYEYSKGDPATGQHKFGVQASQSWTKTIGKIDTTSNSFKENSRFNWEFDVGANTFLFRKIAFQIPFADQIYKDSLGKSFAIRKLNGKIKPTSNAGSLQDVPQFDRQGKLVPISLSKLENDYFRHMKIADIQTIKKSYMDDWIAQGWVVEDVAFEKGVTGKNTLQVVYGSGTNHNNRFINTTGKNWLDQSYETGTKFTFVEVSRDEWSVYLRDDSRDMNVALDLFQKVANFSYGSSGGQMTKFADIVNASQ